MSFRLIPITTLCAAFALNLCAAVRYVDVNSANPAPPYTNWSTAAKVIQDAIDVADPGDAIFVTNGVYRTGGLPGIPLEDIPTNHVQGMPTNRVAVTKPLIVQSVNGPDATIIQGVEISGQSSVRCVLLTNGATLTGFTLLNGAGSHGGGAWCANSEAVLSNCMIIGSSARYQGGGVFSGTLRDCTLIGNVAWQAGGGAYGSTLVNCTVISNSAIGIVETGVGGGVSQSTMYDCTLTGNSAGSGGGAYASTLYGCLLATNAAETVCSGFGPLVPYPPPEVRGGGGARESVLNDCVLLGNSARWVGGGTHDSTLNGCILIGNSAKCPYGNIGSGGGARGGTLNHCIISSNSAPGGGGAMGAILNNCVVSSNSANYGGGVHNGVLNNCTVVSNWANTNGGGVYNITANNSVIYYNAASEGPNWYVAKLRYSCTVPQHFSTTPGYWVDSITNEPVFVDFAAGDLRLRSDSPCINGGANAYATNSADFDRKPRIIGGTVDIGAFEFQTPASALSYGWLQQYGFPTDGSVDYEDTDHDGMTNWQEWRAGTSPTNSLSVLRFIQVTNDSAGVDLTWQAVLARRYFLERATDISDPTSYSVIATNITVSASPESATYTDTNTVGVPRGFYRVGVEQ